MDEEDAVCPECVEVVKIGNNFCPHCGHRIGDSVLLAKKGLYICKGCKSERDIEHRFCFSCGERNHLFGKVKQAEKHVTTENVEHQSNDGGSSPKSSEKTESDQEKSTEETTVAMKAMSVDSDGDSLNNTREMLDEVTLKTSDEDDVILIHSGTDGDSDNSLKKVKHTTVRTPPDTYNPDEVESKRLSSQEDTKNEGDCGNVNKNSVESVKALKDTTVRYPPDTQNPAKIGSKRSSSEEEKRSEGDGGHVNKKTKNTEHSKVGDMTGSEKADAMEQVENSEGWTATSTSEDGGEKNGKKRKKSVTNSDSTRHIKKSNNGEAESPRPETAEDTRGESSALTDKEVHQENGNEMPSLFSGASTASNIRVQTEGTVFGECANNNDQDRDKNDSNAGNEGNSSQSLAIFQTGPEKGVNLALARKKTGKEDPSEESENVKDSKNTTNLKEQSIQTNADELEDGGKGGDSEKENGNGTWDTTRQSERAQKTSYADKLKSGSNTEETANQHVPPGKFYKKSDHPQANYVNPSTSKTPSSSKTKKGNGEYGNDMIRLIFHVVVSPDCHFNPDKDHIQLGSDLHMLGKWNDRKVTLSVKRKLEGNCILMTASISVPKSNLANGHKVEYKYILVRPQGDPEWELVFKKTYGDNIINRSFYIPVGDLKIKDEWTLYDGVMHSGITERGKLKKFWNWVTQQEHKRVVKETKIAAEAMLPRWNGLYLGEGAEPGIAHEALLDIMRLQKCFMHHFLDKDCEKYDEAPFKQVIVYEMNSFL